MTPDPYFFIIIFCGVAVAFPLMPLALAWMWRRFFQPPKPGPAKNATYECGVESIGEARVPDIAARPVQHQQPTRRAVSERFLGDQVGGEIVLEVRRTH